MKDFNENRPGNTLLYAFFKTSLRQRNEPWRKARTVLSHGMEGECVCLV